jgi:hypothetical protein
MSTNETRQAGSETIEMVLLTRAETPEIVTLMDISGATTTPGVR